MTVFSNYIAANNQRLDEVTPPLMGSLGAGGMADEFAARFGSRWQRTPVKGTWAVWSQGVQFTCRWLPDGKLDIGMYLYSTPKEFKKAFETKTLEDPVWFQWEQNAPFKHPYLVMRQKMLEAGYTV